MDFGSLIRLIRRRMNLSVKDVSLAAETSASYLSLCECGRIRPNVNRLKKLEDVYSLPRGSLLDVYNNKAVKKVYISHPLRNGNSKENIRQTSEICRKISDSEKNVLILSPIHAFGFFSLQGVQDPVFAQCKFLLELSDELRVYGDWESSEGCRMEVDYAKFLKLPIYYMGAN